MQQSKFPTVAIVAGTRAARSFRSRFAGFPYPYRTALQLYNRSAAVMYLYIGGELVRNVAPGDVGVYDEDTAIWEYQLDAAANVAAADYDVFEDGGLDVSVEAQQASKARSVSQEV